MSNINFEEDRVDSVTQIDQTKDLSSKVIELRNLEDQIAASENHTKDLKEKAKQLSNFDIPKMMQAIAALFASRTMLYIANCSSENFPPTGKVLVISDAYILYSQPASTSIKSDSLDLDYSQCNEEHMHFHHQQ